MNKVDKYPDWLKIKDCEKIKTFDINEEENGYLIDILNINDHIMENRKNEKFSQVYMTTVYKNKLKGLHVHPFKIDTINCIYGKVCVAFYPEVIEKDKDDLFEMDNDRVLFLEIGDGNHKTLSFPAKYPHGYFGLDNFSIIINYRVPAWTPSDTYQYFVNNKTIMEKLMDLYGFER